MIKPGSTVLTTFVAVNVSSRCSSSGAYHKDSELVGKRG